MPAFRELPMINVVHPAYHAFPNGGQGSFAASGNLRFNCVLVFATMAGLHQSNVVKRKVPGKHSNLGFLPYSNEQSIAIPNRYLNCDIYVHSAGYVMARGNS